MKGLHLILLTTALLGSALATPPSIIPEPRFIEITGGITESPQALRIVCRGDKSLRLGKLLQSEISVVFGQDLELTSEGEGKPGDLILSTDLEGPASGYTLVADEEVAIQGSDLDGLFAGTASLLQALKVVDGRLVIPRMTIKDQPNSGYRALMIDTKNYWHDLEELKCYVRLCRLYKVNYLSLHTGEAQWIGAVTEQLEKLSTEERAKHRLYSKREMDELIAYARLHGVRMLPFCELTPHLGHMKDSMQSDFVPDDEFAGFADELDGKGSFADYDGTASGRWLEVMDEAIQRAMDQFTAGYPEEVLPYFHIGPVLGEGGMGPSLAVRMLETISEKSPETKMMLWNAVNAKDKELSPFKDKIVITYYDDEFGASDMNSYLREGWEVVNSAWSPLYVVGSDLSRPVEKVFEDWHLTRQGSDGVPGGYEAITWELTEDEKLTESLIGGMLCTWEMPQQVHFDRVRTRVAAFAEHAWGGQPWPYADGAYENFAERLVVTDRLLSCYIEEPKEAPAAPIKAKASQGTAKGRIRVEWRGGGGAGATGFRVLRSDQPELGTATDVSGDLEFVAQEFNDTEVDGEGRYFYWVKAFNEHGESELTGPLEGTAGTGVANIASHEPFIYAEDQAIDGAAGGTGWKIPWILQDGADAVSYDPEGLTYGPLTTNGGSLRVNPKHDENHINLIREIDGKMGLDETTMWMSYLVHADKVGDGDVFIVPNDFVFSAVGKNWGRNFALYTTASSKRMKEGKTHFVVARFDFGEGDDVWLWIDPPLDREPSKEEANQTLKTEIGSGSRFRIQLQGHGQGDYRLDEFRLGTSWQSVGGLTGADDKMPPSPNPMTWIGPPSLEEDGSAYMIAAPADDASGVEFYFECVEGGASDSGWQNSSEYRLKDLEPGTYAFRVKCRDRSMNRNESEWSFAGKVTMKE